MSSAAAMLRRESLRGAPKLADETAAAECPDWQKLYDSMRHSVRGKVRRMLMSCGSKDRDYEDVCQEIWLLLWELGKDYWNPRGVNLIARQTALKFLGRNRAYSSTHLPIVDKFDGDQDRTNTWREPFDEMSHLCPDVSKIAAKLMLLPGEQRAVFSFYYQMEGHEQLGFREIGERLGLTTSQAAHFFYQAERNLRAMLGEPEHGSTEPVGRAAQIEMLLDHDKFELLIGCL